MTVNVVAPGLIETDMLPADGAVREQLAATRAVGRLGSSEEVADLVSAVVANGCLGDAVDRHRRRHPPHLAPA